MYLNNLFDGFVVNDLAVPCIISSEDMITAKILHSAFHLNDINMMVGRIKVGLLIFDG